MNLGLALLSAYQDRHDRDELDEAVEQLEAAVQAPSASDREVGDRLTNLGNALLLRYDLDKSIPDLQGAIDACNRAIEVTGSESMRSVGAHFGLAQCLSRGTDRDDWATDEYRLACRLAGPLDPTLRLNVAREWASWSEWREAWNEAAEAYDHALGALQDLYDRQLVRADQELRLEQARDVARRAAIAHVRAHQSDGADLREAVIAIEQGRALWLADALGRRELDAAHIEQSGRVEVERLRKALRALDALRSAPSPDADREPLRQTVQEVRDATDAVRRLPGYEDVFKRGRWSDVEAVAHEQPLVCLIPGDPDGAALILDGDLRSPPLPGFAPSTIASDLAEYMRFLGGGDGRSRSTLTDEWPDVLDRACAWAWDHVMEPVLRAIGEQPGMTLVPVDLLSLLPLHAAWTGDTSGRRYAVDQLSISYAPSAIALRHALTRAGAVNREVNALTVIVPTLDGPSPLKYAAEEMTAVEVLAPSSRVATPEANAERILGELVGRDVVHFACHAVARPSDPLKSALRVDDRDLRLEEILALEGIDARLVVLSACQTALPGLRLID